VSTRLALCSPGEVWGGVEQFVVSLAKCLIETGVPVSGVVFSDGLLLDRLRELRIPVHLVTALGKYDPALVWRLKEQLAHDQINVLHTHGYKAAVIGGLAARLSGVRHVRTEHGQVEPWGGTARVKMRANALLGRAASSTLTDAVVYVSNDIRSRTATKRPAVQEVIYNGIETPAPTQIPLESRLERDGIFNIGIVGRIAPVKGHLRLLQAASKLKHLSQVRYQVIGAGPSEAECRRFCQDNGLTNVCFLGFRSNIHDYLRQLDLLVIPSMHEGLPYTLLEAMFHRLPIIASDVGGLREVLVHEQTALLVPSGDVIALASAIERIVGDPDLRSRLADTAHRDVCERFLASRMASRYLDVYRKILPGSHPEVRGFGRA
jgi:glycosyltransferase involved in cell wall biosynthesis